ncbi:vitamin K epoxide reductase family protein [Sinomicrobium sp. M5D2P17]
MDHCVRIAKKILQLLDIKHANTFLKDSILSHPDHPSLLCISDTLEKYGIENLTVKVAPEKLLELPLPCIVQLSDRGGVFEILEEFSEEKAIIKGNKKESVELSTKEFSDRWTGICLLVEVSKESAEPGIERKKWENNIRTSLTSAIIILLSFVITPILMKSFLIEGSSTIFLIGSILSKLIGLATGVLLLWYEVDKYNPTLQHFCSGGKKIDCDAVLGSKYAKVFNDSLSLGLLGFSYFFGSLSYLIMTGFSSSTFSVLAMLSFVTLSVSILSIYYQGAVIKQ